MSIEEIVRSKTLDYKEWLFSKKLLNSELKTFDEWWSTEMQPAYIDAYWEWLETIKCVEYHKMLFNDDKFFNRIDEYMKKIDWKWTNCNTTPSKTDMINCILELSYLSSQDYNISPVSSGGFQVTFHPNKFLTVSFTDKYSDTDTDTDLILFEKHIGLECLRELKLKNICNGENY